MLYLMSLMSLTWHSCSCKHRRWMMNDITITWNPAITTNQLYYQQEVRITLHKNFLLIIFVNSYLRELKLKLTYFFLSATSSMPLSLYNGHTRTHISLNTVITYIDSEIQHTYIQSFIYGSHFGSDIMFLFQAHTLSHPWMLWAARAFRFLRNPSPVCKKSTRRATVTHQPRRTTHDLRWLAIQPQPHGQTEILISRYLRTFNDTIMSHIKLNPKYYQ